VTPRGARHNPSDFWRISALFGATDRHQEETQQMQQLGKARGLIAIGAIAIAVGACSGGGAATASPSTAAPATTAPETTAPESTAPESMAPESSAPATGEWKIGFSNSFGIGNGFREEQLCTAKAQALVSGQVSEGTWTHQKEETYPQLQQLRDLIAKDVDAIVFNPLNSESLNPALDEAQAAGIKTVAIDAFVTDPETINLSNDQVNYGYVGAKWLFEQVGEGSVYYMRGLAGHPADDQRHEGVLKALSEHPGITLLPSNDGVATQWDPATTTTLINEFINSGQYADIQGIWTSGMDSQVVDAISAAGQEYVPIVGGDLKAFVGYLLNKDGQHEGLTGIAVYNPAAVGGAGVDLALRLLNGETVETGENNTVLLPVPEAWDNVSEEGKAKLEEIYVEELDNLWPVSWYIEGLTDYTFEQMQACKGPGE
jgi:ribose transport system substrate-binding protein